jgi:hypothetical protein
VWERVEWRQGDGRYVFEVARGGLHATLSSPHETRLTLPMVAWEGLLDALTVARKTKARAERNLPSRTGARWSEGETQELVKTFKAGGSVAQLARVHGRTQFAVEAQLERQGLWDRVERRPTARAIGDHALRAGSTNTVPAPALAPAAGRRPYASEQSATPAPVSDMRHDPGQQTPSGTLDTPWPPVSTTASDRRQYPGQQPPSDTIDTPSPVASAPAAGRRLDPGRQSAPCTMDASRGSGRQTR